MIFRFFFKIGPASYNSYKEYLINGFDNKIVKAYYEYIVDVAVIFGADRKRAERELKDSLDFELAMKNVSYTYNTVKKAFNL